MPAFTSDSPEAQMEALLRRLRALSLMRLPQGCELSSPHVAVLIRVSQCPGCGVKDLAEELNVTPPTISVGVRRLVKGGWLERRNDPNDKRAKPLFLTEKSETLLEQLRMHQKKAFRFFLSGLETQEQEIFLRLFDKALSKVEEDMLEYS